MSHAKRQERAAAKRFTAEVAATAEFLASDAYDDDAYSINNKYLGEARAGCSRAMIARNGVAYKMALNTRQIAINRTEYMTFWKFPASVRALTTTPYYISKCGRVIAYELVPSTVWDSDTRNTNDAQKFNDTLAKLLKESGMERNAICELLQDNHECNLGVRADDSLVWLDFCPPRW